MKKKIVLILGATALLSGCSTFKEDYNKCSIAPDGFNYTLAVDQAGMRPAQHYFGLSWSLKDSK
jgi:hypothetical protein